MGALKLALTGLRIAGFRLPLPWLLCLVTVLGAGVQTWRLSETQERLEPLRWQIASLEREKELASGRSDQATRALKEALAANRALEKAYREVKDSRAKQLKEASSKMAAGAVAACREAYGSIHDSIYR